MPQHKNMLPAGVLFIFCLQSNSSCGTSDCPVRLLLLLPAEGVEVVHIIPFEAQRKPRSDNAMVSNLTPCVWKEQKL
eukprot:6137453-Amphidinium_carterae.1